MSPHLKAFVVRIGYDGAGQISGHVSDPLTEERLPFKNAAELWQLLTGTGGSRQAAPVDPAAPAGDGGGAGE